jgi:Zn-dependent M28 family amino/carboxypeptidase
VFVNVTAEEKGLLGSEYYAANPVYPLAKTVADINMDGFDPMGPARNFTVSGNPQSQLLDKLVAAAKDAGLAYTPDPHTETGGFFRSDHFSFAKRGVPSLSFGSGNDLVDGGLAAGEKRRQDYIKNRYHQPADEWQADWSFAGMSHDLGVLYRVGSELANSGEWPQWSADSEFRAVREQTAAQRH